MEISTPSRPRPLIYFPDLRIDRADGGTEILEIKKREEEIGRDPDYAEKILMVEAIYTALGWKFRVVIAEEEIEIDPRYSNAKKICADRWALIGRPAALAIEETFHVTDAVALGKAEEIVAKAGDVPIARATAILHAMVCTRAVAVDVDHRRNIRTSRIDVGACFRASFTTAEACARALCFPWRLEPGHEALTNSAIP